jgi:pimeloyl-ACP methyl ester carboxylesterase
VTDIGFAASADGSRIAYRRLGDGPAIIVIHGGMGSSVGWGPVAARLSRQFEVFLFDRRGRGLSDDGQRPHALQREVEDVQALLEIAGPGATLLGHSFGGAVALETARETQTGQVDALVLYEPAVGVAGAITPEAIERMQALISNGEPDAALDIGIAALDAAELVSGAPRRRATPRPAPLLALAPTVPRELRAVTEPGLDADRYATLDVPTLVLLGTSSPAVQRRNCEHLASTLPRARLEWLDGLGHVAHTAAPDVVAAAVSAFLNRSKE